MKPNKQVIIDFIVSKLKTGMDTVKICSLTCSKFQFTDRSFYNHLKIAQEQHNKAANAINEALAIEDKQNAIEARKLEFMDANARKDILTKIANGELKIKKPFVISGKIMEYPSEPDHTDRRNAIAELNKMDGSYAPIKQANTNVAGEDKDIILTLKEIKL